MLLMSRQDASFIIPQTANGPLYCTSPADIYLLLASSDFIPNDLDSAIAYEGCTPLGSPSSPIKVEMVLRSYVLIDPAREFRCFVRNNVLLGMSPWYCHCETANGNRGVTARYKLL
jgi:hypothetical protein